MRTMLYMYVVKAEMCDFIMGNIGRQQTHAYCIVHAAHRTPKKSSKSIELREDRKFK